MERERERKEPVAGVSSSSRTAHHTSPAAAAAADSSAIAQKGGDWGGGGERTVFLLFLFWTTIDSLLRAFRVSLSLIPFHLPPPPPPPLEGVKGAFYHHHRRRRHHTTTSWCVLRAYTFESSRVTARKGTLFLFHVYFVSSFFSSLNSTLYRLDPSRPNPTVGHFLPPLSLSS